MNFDGINGMNGIFWGGINMMKISRREQGKSYPATPAPIGFIP